MQAFHNGVLVSAEGLSISIYDFGFCRGYSLFENMRVYGADVLHLDDHLERLFDGAQALEIEIPFSKSEIASQIEKLLEMNNFPHSAVKIYITQGQPNIFHLGIGADMSFKPEVFVLNQEFEVYSEAYPYDEKYYKEGLSIASVNYERSVPQAKTTNYIPAIKAGREMAKRGFDDILYVDRRGMVTECSRSNIFFLKEGRVLTPKGGMLSGVTRQIVLHLIESMDIEVEVRDIARSELSEFDGAFLSGSLIEIIPVKCVDVFCFDVPHESGLVTQIFDAYKKYVKESKSFL